MYDEGFHHDSSPRVSYNDFLLWPPAPRSLRPELSDGAKHIKSKRTDEYREYGEHGDDKNASAAVDHYEQSCLR